MNIIGATGRTLETDEGRAFVTIALLGGPSYYVVTSHRDGLDKTIHSTRDHDEALESYRIACGIVRDVAVGTRR